MAVHVVRSVGMVVLILCLAMRVTGDNKPGQPSGSSYACGDQDCRGGGHCRLLTYLPQDSNSGNIVITEFMANPQTARDGNGEWIELYNTTSEPVDIDGWILQDSRGSHVIGRSVVVPARTYIVLSRAGDDVNGLPMARPTSYIYGVGISLANNGDSITLLEGGGKRVAAIQFGPELAREGCTAQLSGEQLPVFSRHMAGVARWCAGLLPISGNVSGRGSPAAANRFCPLL